MVGARIGGGVAALTGTSFAAPIVSGVAALLLSLQLELHGRMDPRAVRAVLLRTATSWRPAMGADRRRFLAGIVDVRGAHEVIVKGDQRAMSDETLPPPAATETSGVVPAAGKPSRPGRDRDEDSVSPSVEPSQPMGVLPAAEHAHATASACNCQPASHGQVYAIGVIGDALPRSRDRRRLSRDRARACPERVTPWNTRLAALSCDRGGRFVVAKYALAATVASAIPG